MDTANTKFHAIIGDMNPIEHDGGVVFERGHGPEMVYFRGWHDGEGPRTSVYEIFIEDNLYETLDWVEWEAVASCVGVEVEELKKGALSENVVDRAIACEMVASYCGFGEFDSQPRELSLEEAEKEYGDFVDAAHAAK